MALPTASELKKLAAACRAAGIKHFKSGDIEFTLSDSPPPAPKPRGKAAQKINHDDGKEPETGEATPTEQELLFWSSEGGLPIAFAPTTDGGNG